MEDEYVTFTLSGQMFGVRVSEVCYVYAPSNITVVPMAPVGIAGLLNLRGRIVTAIDIHRRLGLPGREPGQMKNIMAIGIERAGEGYALLVDQVGEVIRLGEDSLQTNPVNMNPDWASVSKGVHRMEKGLGIILDLEQLLQIETREKAA